MDIKAIPPQLLVPRPIDEGLSVPGASGPQGAGATGFADALKEAIGDANDKSVEAERQVQALVTGEGSLHQAMIAMQDASVAMEMVMAVRNKVLEAYQEVMRMPV